MTVINTWLEALRRFEIRRPWADPAILANRPFRLLILTTTGVLGILTGVATAVKLTPAVIAAYNFFAGKRRAGIVSFFTFLACTAIGFIRPSKIRTRRASHRTHTWRARYSGGTE